MVGPSPGLVPDNTQRDIHVSGGIRTRNPNKWGAPDPRLGPRGHLGALCMTYQSHSPFYHANSMKGLAHNFTCLLTYLLTYLLTCLLIYLLTYLLTLWSRVLSQKLTGSHLVKKSLHFMEPESSSPHLQVPTICPCPEPDKSSPCHHPTSSRSILILSSHIRLGLTSCLFPSVFSTKILYTPVPHTCYMTRPSHYSRFDHANNIWWGGQISKFLIM